MRRAGELLAEGQKRGEIAVPGDGGMFGGRNRSSSATTIKPKTLSDLGISRDQSSQWKELAGIPEKDFEEQLPMHTKERTSGKKIIKANKPKLSPKQLRRQKLAGLALRIWGRVQDIPELNEDEPLKAIVAEMDKQLLDGLIQSIPKAVQFLSELDKEVKNEKKNRS